MSIRFDQASTILSGDDLNQVTTGDINQDGAIDLIVSQGTAAQHSISILLNDGKGGFNPSLDVPLAVASETSITDLQIRDLNRDGALDLVVLSAPPDNFYYPSKPASLSVLLNNRRGGFDPTPTISTPAAFVGSLVIADINGDRCPDITLGGEIAGVSGQGNHLFLMAGDGKGNFKPTRQIRFGSPVLVGDFNYDKNLDFTTGKKTLLGNGKGQFKRISFPAANPTSSSTIGDFNNDGKLDLAFVGTVLLGDGLGKFPKQRFYSAIDERGESFHYSTNSISVGDFNGDGNLDLLSTEIDYSNNGSQEFLGSGQSIFLGKGNGNFLDPFSLNGVRSGWSRAPLIADFNNDGRLDFLVLKKQRDDYFSYLPIPRQDSLELTLNIGTGKDLMIFDGSLVDASREPRGPLTVNLTTGKLKLGNLRRDVTDYRNVVGTPKDDLIVGNGDRNKLNGYRGDDVINGAGGDDGLTGENGRDTLLGMAGDDTLTGGYGNDRLTGGEGQDYFVFEPSGRDPEGTFRLLGIDQITDFNPQYDKLDVQNIRYSRELGFAKTEAKAAKKFNSLVYVQSTGVLYFNPNGQRPGFGFGGAFVELLNNPLLSAENIAL